MSWKFHSQFFMDFISIFSIIVRETGKPIAFLTIYETWQSFWLIFMTIFFCELLTMSWTFFIFNSSGIWLLMIGLLISYQPYLINLTPSIMTETSEQLTNFRSNRNLTKGVISSDRWYPPVCILYQGGLNDEKRGTIPSLSDTVYPVFRKWILPNKDYVGLV